MAANLPLCTGTMGGTLLSMLWTVGAHDVAKTAALAALGAVVSFLVTLLLQRISKRTKR